MKRLIAFVAALIMLLAAALGGCGAQETPVEKWSIYIYLCGSNLETKTGAAGKNLDELLAADIPENVNVIVETGGASKWRSHDIPDDALCRYAVKSGSLSLLERLPLDNMGEGDTLRDFLLYCVENYPANKMCAIMWDHGGGSLNGVCNDENYDYDALSLAEIDAALGAVSENMTGRFELVGLDACLMANYETAYMLSPYARYMLASEEIEPSGGWDYGALLQAIKDNSAISGGELGKAVCDGYYAKCEKSGKQSVATLSVVDLDRFGAVRSAFDNMASEMEGKVTRGDGIQSIARSAHGSQKYGGTTQDEGFSNLIDLRHFAENAVDINCSDLLEQALSRAVVYSVHGSEKSKSYGLSFYYPLRLDGNQLEKYYSEACRSVPYKRYLESVYENMSDEPIIFLNAGEEAEDGSFEIQLDERSRNYILSVEYVLTEQILREEEDGRVSVEYSEFGMDNDIKSNNAETLTYSSNFRGVWLALNGCKLYVTPVETTDKYIIFTSPISLNGERTNLRFAFIWDKSYQGGGYYKILGAWNGIDPVTGMSDKELTVLKPTDEIKAYYPYSKIYDDDEEYYEPTLKEVTIPPPSPGEEYIISEEPLGGDESTRCFYIYQFIVTDIFGGVHYSDAALMVMVYSAEELKENPLPDGVSAALILTVMPMNGESVI